MEKYILDTCTWIEYFHNRHGVREHVEQLFTTQICASEVTLAEPTYGAINSSDYERHIREILPKHWLNKTTFRVLSLS